MAEPFWSLPAGEVSVALLSLSVNRLFELGPLPWGGWGGRNRPSG